MSLADALNSAEPPESSRDGFEKRIRRLPEADRDAVLVKLKDRDSWSDRHLSILLKKSGFDIGPTAINSWRLAHADEVNA